MTKPRLMRVKVDIAEKVAALVRYGKSECVSDLVDPILRNPIEKMFATLPEADRLYALERIARLTTSSS